MTQEQEKVLKCLKRENQKAIKNGAPYVKDETLLEQFCERIPDKNAKHFLDTTYKIIIDTPELSPILAEKDGKGVKPLQKQGYVHNLKLMEVHGIIELLCWELFLSIHTEATPEARKANGELFNKILANMELNRHALVSMSQSQLTQFAAKSISRNTPFQGNLDGTGEYIEGKLFKKNYLMAIIEDFKNSSAVNAQTLKLFVFIHEVYGETRGTKLRLSIDEWLKRQGIEEPTKSDRDNARKTIKNQLRLLQSYTFRGEPTRSRGEYLDVKIIGTHGYKNNTFMVMLDPFYEQTLKNSAPLLTYDTVYKLANETQIKILLKLGWNYRMNEGNTKRNLENLSVKSLLEFCGYPKLEQVKATRNSPSRKIMMPFLADLAALTETDDQLYFTFINGDGEEYTLKEAEELDFDKFYNEMFLHFDQYGHLPQHKKRVASKKSYAEKKQTEKKTTKKTAKK